MIQLEPYRASRFEPLFAIAQKYKSVQKNKFGVLDEKDFILTSTRHQLTSTQIQRVEV